MTTHKSLRRTRAIRMVTPRDYHVAKPTAGQIARHAVEVMAALNDTPPRIADAWDMLDDAHGLGVSVVADTPLLALADALLQPDPAAWVEHTGNVAPVPPEVMVWYDLGAGDRPRMDTARTLAWGAGFGPNREGRIHRWATVATTA